MPKSDYKPVTLINVFFVEPENQERLVEHLTRATNLFVRTTPGFLGSKLHRSLDGKKVAMSARWASEAAYRAARANPASAAWLKEVLAFAALEPGVYEEAAAFVPGLAAA